MTDLLNGLVDALGCDSIEKSKENPNEIEAEGAEYSLSKVTIAGRIAHARKPFWMYREVDPLNCAYLLRAFAGLSGIEDTIDRLGRTEKVIQYWRGRFGQKIWNIIKARCEKMLGEHLPTSELHVAAKYVVTHFTELTYYLKHP